MSGIFYIWFLYNILVYRLVSELLILLIYKNIYFIILIKKEYNDSV